MPAHSGRLVISDELQGVGSTGVFGYFTRVKVRVMMLVQWHIFDQAAKTVDGRPDQRFIFRIDANCLRVTSAFKVKHAVIAPAVLVIANEGAFRVGRKRSFARTAKPKKSATLPL